MVSINGTKIQNLRHTVETLRDLDGEFIEIELGGNYETLVFNRDELLGQPLDVAWQGS